MKKSMIWKHIAIITMMLVFALVSFDISYSEEPTQEQFKAKAKHPEGGKVIKGGNPKRLTPLSSEEDDVEKRQPRDKTGKIGVIEAKKKKREVVLVVGSKVKEVVKDSGCQKDPGCEKGKDKAMTAPLGD